MTTMRPVTLQQVKADWLRVQSDFASVRTLIAAKIYLNVLRREQRFNPYHDKAGRFTTADGAVSGGAGSDSLAGGSGNDPAEVVQAEGDGNGGLDAPASGTNRSGEITSRGRFRSKTLNDAWSNAKPGPNGGRMCSNGCGRELMVPPKSGQPRDWDGSHNPSWSNRTFSPGTSRSDVRDNYQRGTGLECVSCNRSGGNNDGGFSKPASILEGDRGRQEVPSLGGGGGGGIGGRNLQTNKGSTTTTDQLGELSRLNSGIQKQRVRALARVQMKIVNTRPSIANDGWALLSAEERAVSAPDLFLIPARPLRESLAVGSAAKLLFDIETRENGKVVDRGTDRMWVLIKSKTAIGYIGVLDNDPGIAEKLKLHEGDLVAFGPEHICDISAPPRDYIIEKYGRAFFEL